MRDFGRDGEPGGIRYRYMQKTIRVRGDTLPNPVHHHFEVHTSKNEVLRSGRLIPSAKPGVGHPYRAVYWNVYQIQGLRERSVTFFVARETNGKILNKKCQ